MPDTWREAGQQKRSSRTRRAEELELQTYMEIRYKENINNSRSPPKKRIKKINQHK
jgi:hypothetical protein